MSAWTGSGRGSASENLNENEPTEIALTEIALIVIENAIALTVNAKTVSERSGVETAWCWSRGGRLVESGKPLQLAWSSS